MKCIHCGATFLIEAQNCPICEGRLSANLGHQLKDINYSQAISKCTCDFTGRKWVFEAINEWVGDRGRSQFFLLTGEPGSGKSAIAARLKQFSESSVMAPEGCSQLTSKFISVVHICSAQERLSINPHTFTTSVAENLSARYPVFAKALAEKSGDKQISMKVLQKIEKAERSQIQGIIIKNLHVSGILPEDAFARLVREPLKALFNSGFDESVIILVDGLDESLAYSGDVGIVSLLAYAAELPERVRFILTSRNDHRVETEFNDVEPLFISDEKFFVKNSIDIKHFVKNRFHHDEVLSRQLSKLSQKESNKLLSLITGKADGNFQYVTFLLQAMAGGIRSLTELEGLPEGLDALYHDSLRRFVNLGKNDWLQHYAPFLGVLSVAKEPLSLSLLEAFTGLKSSAVLAVVGDLQQLVEEKFENSNKVYKLYHQSVSDFLQQESITKGTRLLRNSFFLPKQEWHEKIVDYYWGKYHGNWKDCGDYCLENLAAHLFEIRALPRLRELISKEWMDARYQGSGFTHNGFLTDVDHAWKSVITVEDQADILTIIKLQAARHLVVHEISFYNDMDLQTLVWLDRKNEALAHARLRASDETKLDGLLYIYKSLLEKGQTSYSLVDELREVALRIASNNVSASLRAFLVKAIAEIGLYDEALEIADTIVSDTYERETALSYLASAFAHAGDYDRSEKMARSIQDKRKSIASLEKLALDLVQVEDDRAKRLIAEVEAFYNRLESGRGLAYWLIDLALAFAQINNNRTDSIFEKARKIICNIAERDSRDQALRKLANSQAQSGRLDKAMDAIKRIQSPSLQGYVQRDLVTIVAEKEQFEEAKALIQLIQDRDLQASARFECLLLQIKCAPDQKSELLEKAKKSVYAFEGYILKDNLKSLVKVLAQVGAVGEAKDFVYSISDIQQKIECLRILAFTLAKCGNASASEIMDEMRAVTHEMQSAEKNPFLLRQLASVFAQEKNYAEAEQIIDSINDEGLYDAALCDLAETLQDKEHYKKARENISKIRDKRNKVTALAYLALSLASTDSSLSFAYFEEAKNIAFTMDDDQQQAYSLSTLVKTLGEAGFHQQAQEIIREIKNKSAKASALSDLAVAIFKHDASMGYGLLDKAEQIVLTIDENLSRHNAFLDLGLTLARVGDSRLESFWATIERNSLLPSNFDKFSYLSQIISALVQIRDSRRLFFLNEIRKLANTYEGSSFDNGALLVGYVDILIQANYLNEAENITDSIKDPGLRACAINKLSMIFSKSDQTKSERLFSEGLNLVLQLEDGIDSCKVLVSMINDLIGSEDKRLDRVREIAMRSLHSVRTDDAIMGQIAGELARQLACSGRISEAITMFGSRSLNEFLTTLIDWRPYFEKIETGLSLKVLAEAMAVASWQHPGLAKVYDRFFKPLMH